ncbi:MAG: serine kinase [Acidobacteria bacterium]|jgi:hypothetical protein|nr:serine kinase [Acidobacteriota bacterium]
MAERQVDGDLSADRIAFFEAVKEGFRRAAQASGTIEKHYRIAGRSVRLRFAGPALVPVIDPALAHLQAQPAPTPDLTIDLFDSASTGARLPLLVRSLVDLLRTNWWEHLLSRREIKGYHGGHIQTAFHLGPDILSVLDTEANHALYWVNDAVQTPYYERGYPLTNLLNWWLGRRGCIIIHAAAVGHETGGVILPGQGGSGKSTTTLACLSSALGIVGDDYCAVDQATGDAHSLYNTVKLKGDQDVERFAHVESFMDHVERVGEGGSLERAMMFLHQHSPGKMLASMPLKGILIPRVTGRPETTIQPASAAAAFKALAPSTIFQLAGNERTAFQALVNLSRSIPAFEIGLGTDIDKIPGVIEQFLDGTPPTSHERPAAATSQAPTNAH